MRLFKYVVIAAVIVSGWWIGYAMKDRQIEVKPAFHPAVPTATATRLHEPQLVDPSLILPPPPEKGEMIDIGSDIRDHFRSRAGLLPKESEVEGPTLPLIEPRTLPIDVPLPDPLEVVPAGAKREPRLLPPPVIRLPAPPDEPEPTPVVKRVLHRQLAMWMYVNQRDLRLNFDITRRGSSGVKAVELWARRSSEQDYECVDRLEGDKPPFSTRLGSEGNYELRLVFVSGSGVKSPTPTRDDPPDVYVCLDTTPPLVEWLPPSADEAGVVRLRWKALDLNMDEQPIHIDYSIDGETWNPVAEANDWLPNTGEYAWKVPAGLPHEMHLRVQARDKAGNVGEARSPSKFSVDLVVPEGRISGVVERGPEPRVAAPPLPNVRVIAEYRQHSARYITLAEALSIASERGNRSGQTRNMESAQDRQDRELLPLPREVRVIMQAEEQERQVPGTEFNPNRIFELQSSKWPRLEPSDQLEIRSDNVAQSKAESDREADDFCGWMQSLRATPVATAEQKRPATLFDAKESAYQRAKGYEPTQFARLPIAAQRLELMIKYGNEKPPRANIESGSFMFTGGGIAPKLCDALDELDPVVAPKLLTDFVIPPPTRPDQYLSNRHASFLEALGPARSFNESHGPGIGFYFDYVPEALPMDWQPPQI